MARLLCERYLPDCENCSPRETTLVNQHTKLSEYCEIIEGAVKEKITSSEEHIELNLVKLDLVV